MGFLKRLSFPMNDVSSDPEVLKPEASDGMTHHLSVPSSSQMVGLMSGLNEGLRVVMAGIS